MAEAPEEPVFSIEADEHIETFVVELRKFLATHDFDVTVKLRNKRAHPAHSSASGPGLERGEVNIPGDFTIHAKDNIGNPITHGESVFEVDITAPDGSKVLPNVENCGNGTYNVSYVPCVEGKHAISVRVEGKEINKSPFSVPIDPPTPCPEKCTAEGPGLERAFVRDPASFVIQARNRIGDNITIGGHDFASSVKAPFAPVNVAVVDNGNGTYSCTYEPIDYGDHHVEVTVLKGQPIFGSPWTVPGEKCTFAADAAKSIAYGPGVEGGCNTALPAEFTVQAIAPSGEKMTVGGDPFDAEVRGPQGEEIPCTLVDNKDGTYSGSYQPLVPEKHEVDVILRHHITPLYYEHISGSPFLVEVLAGIDPSKCIAFGPGLEPGVLDTKPAEFTIQARDIIGRDIKAGGDPFVVVVKDPSGKDVPADVVDNGDGSYAVTYAPSTDGEHVVEVTLKDAPVGQSPYIVAVGQGTDYNTSNVDRYSFVIQARSKKGNVLKVGGELFVVEITNGSTGKAVEGVEVSDIGDGTYVVTYRLTDSGEYTISCQLMGQPIVNSPWKQIIP